MTFLYTLSSCLQEVLIVMYVMTMSSLRLEKYGKRIISKNVKVTHGVVQNLPAPLAQSRSIFTNAAALKNGINRQVS